MGQIPNQIPPKEEVPKDEVYLVAEEKDFPTRRALEELNDYQKSHYETNHGGGSVVASDEGPMDHEA